MLESLKGKLSHVKESLTIKFHAVLASIGGVMSAAPDWCNQFIANASQVMGQVQPLLDPATITMIGKLIAVVSVLTMIIRASHNSTGSKAE